MNKKILIKFKDKKGNEIVAELPESFRIKLEIEEGNSFCRHAITLPTKKESELSVSRIGFDKAATL